MTTTVVWSGASATSGGARRARAWQALVVALALHVSDEALTHFLDFYNPIVLGIRARVPWFPAPTFTFGPWLAGLLTGVVLLWLLTPAVRRGARLTRFAAVVFSVIMIVNALGHLGGSLLLGSWLPGATSSPLLLAAACWLAVQVRSWDAPLAPAG